LGEKIAMRLLHDPVEWLYQKLQWCEVKAGLNGHLLWRLPGFAIAHHGVKNGQDFVEAGGQGNLLGFAFAEKALIEGSNDWAPLSR
jgi:hypothetical protein